MKTLAIPIDDALEAALISASSRRGRREAALVVELLHRFVAIEELKRRLQQPDLAALYETLAEEDIALAETGLDDYQRTLRETDHS